LIHQKPSLNAAFAADGRSLPEKEAFVV